MRCLIDTNVLLRFLRGDDPALSPRARALFESAAAGTYQLVLTDLVLAEVVWVLASHYKTKRQDITDALLRLIVQPGIECTNPAIVTDALHRFRAVNVDFTDCFLAAHAVASNNSVASFDADFRKFKGVKLVRPGAE